MNSLSPQSRTVPTHTIIGYQSLDGVIHLDLSVIEYNELSKALTHMNRTRATQRKYQAKQLAEKNLEKQKNKPNKTLYTLDFVSDLDNQIVRCDQDIEPEPPTTPPNPAPMMRYPNININVTKAPWRIARPIIPKPSSPNNILKEMTTV